MAIESRRRTVSFQGEHGAYSEQAAKDFFGEFILTKPCNTLKQVFRSADERAADFGVVPAENSLEGSVNQTYDLLLQTPLKISAEVKSRSALPAGVARNQAQRYPGRLFSPPSPSAVLRVSGKPTGNRRTGV